MSHLIELNANYVAKYETEFDVSLRRIKERLDNLKAQWGESSPSESGSQPNSESTSKSNPDLSQKLESTENLFQAKKRKMMKRVVRSKKLWSSFRSKISASNQNKKKLSKDDIVLL